jgi:hypothetical protein
LKMFLSVNEEKERLFGKQSKKFETDLTQCAFVLHIFIVLLNVIAVHKGNQRHSAVSVTLRQSRMLY